MIEGSRVQERKVPLASPCKQSYSGTRPPSNYLTSHFSTLGSPIDSTFFCEEQNVEPGRHIANLRLAFLPSSLTNTLPFILGYSPCPPVSVCGTDALLRTLEDFPGTPLLLLNPYCYERRQSPSDYCGTDLPIPHPQRPNPNPIRGKKYRDASLLRITKQFRNINLMSIDYAFQPGLRTD